MRRRTIVRGGLGLLITATLAFSSGCDRDATGSGNTPTRTPVQQLSYAAARLQEDTYKMTTTWSTDGQRAQVIGLMDPVKKLGEFTATADRKSAGPQTVWQQRIIGDVIYIKTPTLTGLPGAEDKPWRRINHGAETAGADWTNGAQMAAALQKATSVRRVNDTTFTGSLDLTASATAMGVPMPAASDKTTRVFPFEARVDDAGRLVRYSVDVPTLTGGTDTVTTVYSDFGIAVSVPPPPTDQIRN